MARNRFTKLNLGPMTEARHRSVAGSIIIADYIDPVTAQRTLVLEKVAVAAKAPTKRKVIHSGSIKDIQPSTPNLTPLVGASNG